MVDIAGKDWAFVIVHGRQYWEGELYESLIDPEAREIRITDTVPLQTQLELAAQAAVIIFREAVGLVPLLAAESPPCAGNGPFDRQ